MLTILFLLTLLIGALALFGLFCYIAGWLVAFIAWPFIKPPD